MNYINPNLLFENIPTGKVGWCSPSNIALIKYWGKKGNQIPTNASLSFTLSKSQTETTIEFSPSTNNHCSVEFFLEGIPNNSFAGKISVFLSSIVDIFPFLEQLDFRVYSKNSFPHSAGIASSASGMSAIALSLCDIENQYFNTFKSKEDFFKKASYVARLGSGSACRSIYGGLVSWGDIDGGSNLYASKLSSQINSVFDNYHDSILIVDSQEKKVSSTVGHGLMNTNPFAEGRFIQANENITKIIGALNTGNLIDFVEIVEKEALTLHAMMMTSSPHFLLMRPNTISIIEKIWEFRNETKVPICFTLDAGPNIHLLYPQNYKYEAQSFINSDLIQFTQDKVIHDIVGGGPEKLKI